MRRGEILGLRWKDVDLEKGMLYVRQTLSKDGKRFLTGAKTDSSVRSIKLSNETVAILRKHKARIATEKLQSGADYTNHDLVVCTSKGTPMNPENVKRTFTRLIKKAGIYFDHTLSCFKAYTCYDAFSTRSTCESDIRTVGSQ